MNENKINEIALHRIAEELEDIWDFGNETYARTCFVIDGIIALKNELIDALAERPEKEE